MAWAVSLTCSTGSLSLVSDTGIKILDFSPTVSQDKSETGITTDTYPVFINGSDNSTMRGLITEVNTYFTNARDRQITNDGRPIQLLVAVDGSSDLWRSDVLDGDFVPSKIQTPNWTNGEVWGNLFITRRNYWEKYESIALTLANENSSASTSNLPVFFCNDSSTAAGGTRNNYADILGSEILGDLPAIADMQLQIVTSAASSSATIDLLTVYTQIGKSDANTAWFIDKSGTAEATASGGEYLTTSSSGGLSTISCTATEVRQIALFAETGDLCRIIGRVGFSLGAGTYRIIPTVSRRRGSSEVINPVYVTVSDSAMHVAPLGVSQIGFNSDDYSAGYNNYKEVILNAYVASGDVNVDFLSVAGADCVRDFAIEDVVLKSSLYLYDGAGYSTLESNDLWAYGDETVNVRTYKNLTAYGDKKLRLLPGINQRIVFNCEPWNRDYYGLLTMYVRFRRSSL